MLIDIIYAVLLVLAVIHGYSRGLILGVFSFIAIIVGIAAAMKLSTVVADFLRKNINVSEEWLPLISFLLIFLVVVLLIRLAAKAIEKSVQFAMLGWVNRVGGIVFYAAIYTLVFSILLFYATQMKMLNQSTIDKSLTYSFIEPWGPKIINGFGSLIPIFRDMFDEVQRFFQKVGEKISQT